MKLYLSSYRLGDKTEDLKKLVNNNEVTIIPNALDIYQDGEKKHNLIMENCKDLERLGIKTNILDLKDYFKSKDILQEKLKSIENFYVLGGNVFSLRTAMKLSGFDLFLKSIINNDNYLYIAFSAGMCVLGPDLFCYAQSEQYYYDTYKCGKVYFDGLNILDYVPVPHCNKPNNARYSNMNSIVRYLEDNDMDYIALKDGDVIINNSKKIVKKLTKNNK